MGGKDDPVNEPGLAYYDQLIDALLAEGITPWVTLYHWDLPLELEKRYGGWQTDDKSQIIDDFVSYAGLLFERYGDRVKNWITLNEVRSYFGSPCTLRTLLKPPLVAAHLYHALELWVETALEQGNRYLEVSL